jgi:hypothetical protein
MGVAIQVNNGEWACSSKKPPLFENSRSATENAGMKGTNYTIYGKLVVTCGFPV